LSSLLPALLSGATDEVLFATSPLTLKLLFFRPISFVGLNELFRGCIENVPEPGFNDSSGYSMVADGC
jgi:hypothetical protein